VRFILLSMRSVAWFCVLLPAGLFACSDATGSLRGGDYVFDAGAALTTGDANVGPSTACQAGGANSGSRWQDLYACFFGPAAPSSCTSSGICHGASDQAGTLGSGFVCGPSSDACWQGMTTPVSSGFQPLVPPAGATDATTTMLYSALRKPDPGNTLNNMPFSPATFVFQTDDLTRIKAWIQAGAKND
jgi:hypothetical protein